MTHPIPADPLKGQDAFRPVARPVDVTDAKQFPEIARARAHLAAMPADRRAMLNAEWEIPPMVAGAGR